MVWFPKLIMIFCTNIIRNVFQDAFSQGPNLQLEALTGDDIEHYVKSMLISSPAFKDMQVLSPSAAGILVENVTKKASGVFIWVVLVIQSLLEGLQDGERLSNLQSRLDTLPINLEELFMKILRSVDDKHFQRASWYFQIYNKLAEIGDSPEVFFFSFADSLESSIEPGSSISQMNSKELELEASLTKRRLNACTKGLLEVSSVRSLPNYMAHVNFLHRTVRDFINAPEVFSTLLDATENDFDSDARIAQTYTLALKGIDPAVWKDHGRSTAKAQKYLEELIYKGIHFAVKSDPGCQGDQLPLLQGLYRAGQRTVNLVGWSMYWPSCLQSVTRVSLLKLLVVCQLAPCLSHFLQPQPTNDFQGVVSKSELNELLYLAITSFIDSTDVMKLCVFSKSFDLEIISILLNAGANPDSKCLQSNGTIREYALEHYGSESKELMAMLRKSRTHRRSRILKMFRGDP
jgi:hypothetical protein